MSLVRSALRGIGYPLVGIVGIAFAPVALPVLVALDYRDLADRLSTLPAVEPGGGARSGAAAAAYVACVGVVAAGCTALGGVTPTGPGTAGPPKTTTAGPPSTPDAAPTTTATATPSPTERPTATPSPTPTPTPTPSPTPTATDTGTPEMGEFKRVFKDELKYENTRNETVSVNLTSTWINSSNVFHVRYRVAQPDNTTRAFLEQGVMAGLFAISIERFDGIAPYKAVFIGNSTGGDKIIRYEIMKPWAEAYNDGRFDVDEYLERIHQNTKLDV